MSDDPVGRVSVVVPVFNGAHVLPTTVPAVLALSGVDEWVWVDDGSADNTPAVLASLTEGAPGARVVRLPDNRGRSAARNAGVAAASGETLVFFDADVRPSPNAAERLAEPLSDPAAVASVGRVRAVLDAPGDPFQRYLGRHPRGPVGSRPGDVLPWKFFLTGLCAVRRSALRAAGGFDEGVAYGEDLALACRLRSAHPDGLRLADVTIDLFDVGTLDRALANMAAFGAALPRLARTCPDVLSVAGVARAAESRALLRLARRPPLRETLRRALPHLPAAVQVRAVRYLLGVTLLSAYAGAQDRPPQPD